MKGFRIPFISNITPEKSIEIDEKVNRSITYASLKDEIIKKKFIMLNSDLRRVADYVYKIFLQEESYKNIANNLELSEGTVRLCISDLNFWREFPIRLVPVKKKSGYIQSSLKNPEDTEACLQRTERTITTMERRYENLENSLKLKRRKKVQKLKNENKKKILAG